jgi:hypothetical protein
MTVALVVEKRSEEKSEKRAKETLHLLTKEREDQENYYVKRSEESVTNFFGFPSFSSHY